VSAPDADRDVIHAVSIMCKELDGSMITRFWLIDIATVDFLVAMLGPQRTTQFMTGHDAKRLGRLVAGAAINIDHEPSLPEEPSP